MKPVHLAIFKESTQEWQWLAPMSMSDAVRMTMGPETRGWMLHDPTGYLVCGNGQMFGDLTTKYKKTLRALRHRGEVS